MARYRRRGRRGGLGVRGLAKAALIGMGAAALFPGWLGVGAGYLFGGVGGAAGAFLAPTIKNTIGGVVGGNGGYGGAVLS